MKYETRFNLVAPVTDTFEAQKYLSEDDMTVYLKNDDRVNEFKDSITHIEWQLDDEISGRVILYTSARLTEDELKMVSAWVGGQNSDGLGEGFEQQSFANYKDEDSVEEYWDEEDEEYYETEPEWIMASFDWETNDYIFTEVSEVGNETTNNEKEEENMVEVVKVEEAKVQEAEVEVNEPEITRKAKDYVARTETFKEAIELAQENIKEKISEFVERLDEDELLEILRREFGEEIYEMSDLDERLENCTPTEILNDYCGIDTCDNYFNEENGQSSNDLWELVETTSEEKIVNAIYDEELYISGSSVNEILDEGRELIDEVRKVYFSKAEDKAKKLFEDLVQTNAKEVLEALTALKISL